MKVNCQKVRKLAHKTSASPQSELAKLIKRTYSRVNLLAGFFLDDTLNLLKYPEVYKKKSVKRSMTPPTLS